MIKQKEYARRRRQLMRRAGEDAIIVLQAAPARIRNNDAHYAYRQDSDFMYLTGFPEHDALLVMIPDEDEGECILFCRDRDPTREMWDGRMVGIEKAVADYGMDQAFDIKEAETRLRDMLPDRERIYHDLGRDPMFDQRLIGWLNEFRGESRKTFHAPEEIHALDHMLHRFTRIVGGMTVNEERMRRNLEKIGLKGQDTSELFFEDCRVPAENLLGNEGDGYRIALANLEAGRIGIAAQSISLPRNTGPSLQTVA